jgi:hypothetical protein
VLPILEGVGPGCGLGFHLGYSPERIDLGNTDWTLVTTQGGVRIDKTRCGRSSLLP